MIGGLIIAFCAMRGARKGFVKTVGSVLSCVLAVVFVYLVNTWALEALLLTLLSDYKIVIARLIICTVLYVVVFFVLRALLGSMKVLAKLPVLHGLDKIFGGAVGTLCGMLIIGIIFTIFP